MKELEQRLMDRISKLSKEIYYLDLYIPTIICNPRQKEVNTRELRTKKIEVNTLHSVIDMINTTTNN